MRLLILAGGFGTRLRSVVSDVPKVLAPVNEKPFLGHQINNWLAQGVNDFTFLLHYKAEQIVNYVLAEQKHSLRNKIVNFSIEETAKGTGGATALAIKDLHLEGDFICVNADTWIDGGLARLNEHPSPSLGLVKVADCARYGSVSFNQKKEIVGFHEKSTIKKTGWVSSGMVKLNSSFFSEFGSQTFSLEAHLYPKLIEEQIFNAVLLQHSFTDIGIPEDYHKFKSSVLNRDGA